MPIYGPIQNFGGRTGGAMIPSFIPPRPFVGVDAHDQDMIEVIFYRWLYYILGGSAQNVIGAGGRFINITGSAIQGIAGREMGVPEFTTSPWAAQGYTGYGGPPFAR
jgi:hypothetical protein